MRLLWFQNGPGIALGYLKGGKPARSWTSWLAGKLLGSVLLGQEFLKYGHLRQLFGGQVRAVLLGEDRRGVGPLLGQLGDDLQHVGVGQFGDFRSRRLGFDDVFLGIAQCAQTHGILGLHGLHDTFRNLLFE